MPNGAKSPVLQMTSVLQEASPKSCGISSDILERLYVRIEKHIVDDWYPGAAVAMARRGALVASKTFGIARLGTADDAAVPVDEQTMFLLYSQTKPVVSCAVWMLIEQGLLRFHDTVAEYIPEFARHGKQDVTIYHLLSHQAGFPDANVEPDTWENHTRLREAVCDFTLDWEPGAKVFYHRGASHWVQAMLIEAVTGQDYRQYIREHLLDPLGLHGLHVSVPDELHDRLSRAYARTETGHELLADRNSPAHARRYSRQWRVCHCRRPGDVLPDAIAPGCPQRRPVSRASDGAVRDVQPHGRARR